MVIEQALFWAVESTITATALDTHSHAHAHARTHASAFCSPATNQEVASILGRTVPGSAGSRVRLQLRLTTPGDGSPTNFTAPKGQLPVTLSLSLSGWPATLSDRRLPLKVTFRESSII